MVQLSPETVQDFKKLFKEEYDVEYSDTEAWEAAHNLVGFFDLLLKVDRRIKVKEKRRSPSVSYTPVKDENRLNCAFDVLFNELEKQRK